MQKFEVGKCYSMRSICDHNCVWTYEVVARTAQYITIREVTYNECHRLRVNQKASEWSGAETVRPLGNYSMAPSLRADNVA